MSVPIFYALNESPSHGAMAARSMRSIRRQSARAKLRVFMFGKPPQVLARACDEVGAEMVEEAPRPHHQGTLLKWFAACRVPERRALYLDADTICTVDPAHLLSRYTAKELYARVECGTLRDEPELIGSLLVQPQLYRRALRVLRRAVGARTLPVLNTGVMVFNAGITRKLADAVAFMAELSDAWREERLPYPCRNAHIAEEIAASVALGRVDGMGVGRLRVADAPWFVEVLSGLAPADAPVLHVWSAYYPHFLERTWGAAARARFERFSRAP